MPLLIDRSSEAPLSSLFDSDFIRSLTQYLGLDPDTPSEDMPLSVTELLEEAISTCEQDQWRFIIPKEVILQLPTSAFKSCDNALVLPLGISYEVAVMYKDKDEQTVTFTDYTLYSHEPMKLWSEDWSDMTDDCIDKPYPISVVYTPGYTSYADIPKSTIRALKVLVYYNFEFRGSDAPVPKAYTHNMMLSWLNNERALKYIIDDWDKVYLR